MPPRSSLARAALAIATFAIGLAALKANAPYWVGLMTGVVAFWLVVAWAEMIRTRGRAQLFWGGFLAASITSLAISFGPWSDHAERGGALGWSVDKYRPRITPLSYALAKAMALIEPNPQGYFDVGGEGTSLYIKGIYWIGPGIRSDGLPTFIQQLNDSALAQVARSPGIMRRVGSSGGYVVMSSGGYVVMPDYQDAGHLLSSLFFGAIAGLLATWFAGIFMSCDVGSNRKPSK